jgi:methylmalonyl-CoA/ethylmalonyl-CoA epimerase
MIKRIDHIALVVADLPPVLAFWRDALGLELKEIEAVPEQKAQVAFLPLGDSNIELVRPTAADTGLAKYLAKRGEGMHHVCVEVDDIEAMLTTLKAKGIRLIDETPRHGSRGKRYAFIHPEAAHGVLVELYQLPGEARSAT